MPLVTRSASTQNLYVQSAQPQAQDGAWIDSDDGKLYTLLSGTASEVQTPLWQLVGFG